MNQYRSSSQPPPQQLLSALLIVGRTSVHPSAVIVGIVVGVVVIVAVPHRRSIQHSPTSFRRMSRLNECMNKTKDGRRFRRRRPPSPTHTSRKNKYNQLINEFKMCIFRNLKNVYFLQFTFAKIALIYQFCSPTDKMSMPNPSLFKCEP